jgi:transcriptional regulator
MYLPTLFKEERLPILHDAIRQAGLAMLVTNGTDGPEVSHVPLLLDPGEGTYGTLYGHLARANDQWRTADTAQPALAVFTGPDSYISPSFYKSKAVHGKVVPTWNYVAIHARGRLRFFHEAAELHEVVSRLTNRHEGERAQPWAVTDAPEAFVQSQLRAIVGFSLHIETLEGKWKMSQNRTEEDRAGVRAGLSASDNPAEQAVGGMIPP